MMPTNPIRKQRPRLKYPSNKWEKETTRVRFDIENNSDTMLRWHLPIPGKSDTLIRESESGIAYSQKNGYGWMFKDDGSVYMEINEDLPYIVSIMPSSKGTIFLHFDGIPVSVGEMEIDLDGFLLEGDKFFNVTLENIQPVFDIAPIP